MSSPHEIDPSLSIYEFLKNTVDSSTTMKVDGSTVNKKFRYTSPDGFVSVIERINSLIMCNNPLPSKFGNVTAANGMTIKIHDASDNVILDYLPGESLTNHSKFAYLAGTDVAEDAGAGDDAVPIRWTLSKSGHQLILTPGRYIEFTVKDNLIGLSHFKTYVQGFKRKL